MRFILLPLVLAIAFVGQACSPPSAGADQDSLARDAYHQIEGNVFKFAELHDATLIIESAHEANPNDPWVYLAASLATLVSGYQIGDWYEEATFREGTVTKALELATQARVHGPNESQAYAHLARLRIIQAEYETAVQLLEEALHLDSASYYPWYFRGIAAVRMGNLDSAWLNFDEAEKRAVFPYQQKLLNLHRQDAARLAGDRNEHERLLRENIRRHPSDPHIYGNYAHFLTQQERFAEAVEYWEKAVEFGPYPEAVNRLQEAKKRAEADAYDSVSQQPRSP